MDRYIKTSLFCLGFSFAAAMAAAYLCGYDLGFAAKVYVIAGAVGFMITFILSDRRWYPDHFED